MDAPVVGVRIGRVSTLIRPSGRMQRPLAPHAGEPLENVSTLIRPSGRMQPAWRRAVCPRSSFNPHPTFRPDATRPPRSAWSPTTSFNPHPTFRPDATSGLPAGAGAPRLPVSTLIRPSGRMQHQAPVHVVRVLPVSTLIRPSGRMQRAMTLSGVNPPCFNPHPTFRPDATYSIVATVHYHPVSTLIRPSGRMQPHGHHVGVGNLGVSTLIRPSGRMQLEPTQVVNGIATVSTLIRPSGRMQPDVFHGVGQVVAVSTLIRPSGRMQLRQSVAILEADLFQPSSDLQAGCNRAGSGRGSGAPPCFNPHPTFRPDATGAEGHWRQ